MSNFNSIALLNKIKLEKMHPYLYQKKVKEVVYRRPPSHTGYKLEPRVQDYRQLQSLVS